MAAPEFMAGFEEACPDRGIRPFVLRPRSSNLNGHVERDHRTHTAAFSEFTTADSTVAALNASPRHWEHISNYIRPHQFLSRRTPSELLGLRPNQEGERISPMY